MKAKFWNNGKCSLCYHNCAIKEGKRGICGVREVKNGELISLIYGKASSVHKDPIEKKPFYHFFPGSYSLSFGSIGCNFRCSHCQNYSISQVKFEEGYLQNVSKEEVFDLVKNRNCQGVSWTYNEPTIWHEFSYDSSKFLKEKTFGISPKSLENKSFLLRIFNKKEISEENIQEKLNELKDFKGKGLYTNYVTNGYIQESPLKELSFYLDAMNIDVKSFTDDFYRKICKAKLQNVLNTCEIAVRLGIWVELTYLIIPTLNDTEKEFKEFSSWVVNNLNSEVPVHFSRFHPDYQMLNLYATPMETLLRAYKIAKENGVKYVYLGNVWHGEYDNTYCEKCGKLLIERIGYDIKRYDENGKCTCGNKIKIVEW